MIMTWQGFAMQAMTALGLMGLAFYFPGRLFLRFWRLSLNPVEKLTASLGAGMALFTLATWGCAALDASWLLWLLVLAAAGGDIAFRFSERERTRKGLVKPAGYFTAWQPYWPLGLLALAGMLIYARLMVASGWASAAGMDFLAWHAHDAPWHMFNLTQFGRAFPPEMPGVAGLLLKNYHYFSDLLWSGFLRLAPLNPWHVYFRIAPFFYSLMLSLAVFVAALAWSRKAKVAYLAVALATLVSNFGYVLPLLAGPEKYFIWDSIFWVQSPGTMIFNPGVASSMGLLMLGLWALTRWVREKDAGFLAVLALVWGVLPGFKVYAGLLVLAALLGSGLILLLKRRGDHLLTAALCLLPVSALVFWLPMRGGASLVKFLPGFNLASMLAAPDRMALMSTLELKIIAAQKPWLLVLLMAAMLLVFVVGNFGIRAISLAPMLRNLFYFRRAEPVLLFMTMLCLAALAGAVLFVQTGVPWNTIQFFYFAVLVSCLPAARQFWRWVRAWKPRWQYAALAGLLLPGLPGMVHSMWVMSYSCRVDPAMLSAMEWIRGQGGQGAMLRPLSPELMSEEGFAQWKKVQNRGRMTSVAAWQAEAKALAEGTANTLVAAVDGATLAARAENLASLQRGKNFWSRIQKPGQAMAPMGWMDAAWMAALSGRNTYLEDTVSAQIMGYPVEQRLEALRYFYLKADEAEARLFLETNRVEYVILPAGWKWPFEPEGVVLKPVFANEAMTIYKYINPVNF